MRKSKIWLSATLLSAILALPLPVCAEDYVLALQNHQFSPQQLTIPANQKVKITVKNLDDSPAEFESSDLNREKVVAAKSEINLFIGPIDAGTYGYFDDFHRATTTGTIVAK